MIETTAGLRPLALDDRSLFLELVQRHRVRSCAFNFVQVFANAPLYRYECAEIGGRVVLVNRWRDRWLAPLGEPLDGAGLAALSEMLGGVAFHHAESVADDVHEHFSVTAPRDEAEYVYDVEALASMAGGPLQKKRAAVARFCRAVPEFAMREAGPDECVALAKRWADDRHGRFAGHAHAEAFDEAIDIEGAGLLNALAHAAELDLCVLGLYAAEKLVAFDVFSGQVGDLIHLTYEKHDRAYPDAVPALRMLASRDLLARGIRVLNVGRDLAFPGLRASKLSYRPTSLLHTLTLTPR